MLLLEQLDFTASTKKAPVALKCISKRSSRPMLLEVLILDFFGGFGLWGVFFPLGKDKRDYIDETA